MWEIVKEEFPEKQQKAIEQLKEKCPKFYNTYFVPTVHPKLSLSNSLNLLKLRPAVFKKMLKTSKRRSKHLGL